MIIVLTTYPDRKKAESAAASIVKQGLAACVNVIKIESSHYKWKGKIVKAQEFLLVIKTTEKRYKKLEAWIKKNHPYELPEIIKVPVTGGLKAYLDRVS
jgi:periplasmic divalent cation tolerance protein